MLDMPTKTEKARLTIFMEKKRKDELIREAEAQGLSLSQYIRLLIGEGRKYVCPARWS